MKTFLRNYHYLAIAGSIFLIFLTCKQRDLEDIGFPRVQTLVVEMISDTGAVFKGEILDLPSDCDIVDHGFVWSETKDATSYLEKVSLGNNPSKGAFQASANRAMTEGKKYYFKAFIQTSKVTVFGNELDFVSMGSHGPFITSISPDSGSWNDTIIIRGKYFGNSRNRMNVLFNNTFAGTADFISDNLIKVNVPFNLDTAVSKVSIKFDNVLYPSDKLFKLQPNVKITSIEPTSGSWNTTVKIRGKNLRLTQAVYFDKTVAKYKLLSDSVLEASVPYNLNTENSEINIKINKFIFNSPQKFAFILGKVSSISPEMGTVGTQVLIKVNNIRTLTAKVTINGVDAPVKTRTDSSLTVTMPQLQKSGSYPIVIADGSFQIVYENVFEYKIPEVTSKYPEMATRLDTISLVGKNFNLYEDYIIKIGMSTCKIISIEESLIKFVIPYQIQNALHNITLSSNNYNFSCSQTFMLAAPTIESIETIKENAKSYLIINGSYFGPYTYNYNTFYDVIIPETNETLYVESQSNTRIKCLIPSLVNGIYSIKLDYNFSTKPLLEEKCFSISDSPFTEYLSQKNPDYKMGRIIKNDQNSFFISTSKKDFLFNSEDLSISEIVKFLPSNAIILNNSRDIIYLDINDRFMKKTNLDTKSTVSISTYSGTFSNSACGIYSNEKNYFLGFSGTSGTNSNYLQEYNGNWNSLVLLPINGNPINLFDQNNELYIIGLFNSWKYSNNTITNLRKFPGNDYPYLFTKIDHKTYFYANHNSKKSVFEYNLLTNEWKLICSFPYSLFSMYSYAKNGKGYFTLITNDGTFKIIEFDPSKINM